MGDGKERRRRGEVVMWSGRRGGSSKSFRVARFSATCAGKLHLGSSSLNRTSLPACVTAHARGALRP